MADHIPTLVITDAQRERAQERMKRRLKRREARLKEPTEEPQRTETFLYVGPPQMETFFCAIAIANDNKPAT